MMEKLEHGVLTHADSEAHEGFLFPMGRTYAGHSHIHHNGFEICLKSLEPWPLVERAFRGLARFLSKKGLRDLFRHCLLHRINEADCAVLSEFCGGCYTWKWDKLEILLLQLYLQVPALKRNWRNEAEQDSAELNGQAIDPEEKANQKELVAGVTNALKLPCVG